MQVMQSHTLSFLHTDLLVYVLASYLNKVGVSFHSAGYDLSLHAVSEDFSYFYKCCSNIQYIILIIFPGEATEAKHAIVINGVVQNVSPERANSLS